MESGYDVEPRPVGRSARRWPWAGLIVVALVLLGAVVVKPWTHVPSSGPVVAPDGPFHSPAFAIVPVERAPEATPDWPAASVPSQLADATALQAERALRSLSLRSGTWGVGNAGVGPRMLREEPWSDWVAAGPESVDGGPLHVAMWPGSNLCQGFPTIYDHPSLVAVTTPADLVPDWQLVGWWTDGQRVAPLDGSVRQISPAGNRGISYLERTDRAQWPRGRYEFHVIAGDQTVALTVCITRRG
jgi:hypothetical protein